MLLMTQTCSSQEHLLWCRDCHASRGFGCRRTVRLPGGPWAFERRDLSGSIFHSQRHIRICKDVVANQARSSEPVRTRALTAGDLDPARASALKPHSPQPSTFKPYSPPQVDRIWRWVFFYIII